jgi:sirohydrochlorin ferrochelatase
MKAVLLISHGSRSPETKREVADLVERLRRRRIADIIEYSFLELETPNIPQGIDQCASQGADHIIVLLNFLNSGRHVDQDIPQIIREAQTKYPKVTISITKPVGQHPGIEDLFSDLVK